MLSKINATAVLRMNMRMALVNQEARDFGAKRKKKAKKNPADDTEYETVIEKEEPQARAAVVHDSNQPWARSTSELNLDKSLFAAFTVGDVKVVESAPDNKAPSYEDSIEGRYANVLFTTASHKAALFNVYEDLMYLKELYTHCEPFRLFTENGGVGMKEIVQLNDALRSIAPFHECTIHFLTVLAENKRLYSLKDIAVKYQKLYQQFNKEEKITIISAEQLSGDQQSQVLAALKANPQNAGKEFTIEYQVDASIQGGLQMYTESEFMDMSIASRMMRINEEVAKLSM
jgi:F-type H+-transporting ATPase subunit O